jgi:hypothetical protein
MSDAAWQDYITATPYLNRRQRRRREFDAGFTRGQDDAASKIAELIEGNVDLLKSFAGERTPEMIVHLLRHLRPDDVTTSMDSPATHE